MMKCNNIFSGISICKSSLIVMVMLFIGAFMAITFASHNAADVIAATKLDENDSDKANDNDDTVYCVGSVSKVYVTVAAMQLVDSGDVELDAPVTKYIPEFKMADERYKDITVRMLMNHTSGLMGTTLKNAFTMNEYENDRNETLLKNLRNQHLKANPGEYACYCNDGFDLLQIIIERVSGLDYTSYVEKNIADKLGATSIGTPDSLEGSDKITDVYMNGMRQGKEYVAALGAGGIYSNAIDTCEFGSAFFKGDNRLLSEKSKNEMNTLSCEAPYTTYGLGWDSVSFLDDDSKVKIVSKGGDSLGQHTGLLVAPDEEISVCVTSSGGSSSYNEAMAAALMSIALEEKGITRNDVKIPEVKFSDEVPNKYKKYEGYYVAGANSGPVEVTFPDMKYMKVSFMGDTTTDEYYKYSDHEFVRVTGDIKKDDVNVDRDYNSYTFEERNGKTYIVYDRIPYYEGLITGEYKGYEAENLERNPVSEDVLEAWKKRENVTYELYSDKYYSSNYERAFGKIKVLDETGYVIVGLGDQTFMQRIVDDNHVAAFTTVPGNANRDMVDFSVDKAGKIHSTSGISFVPKDNNKTLNGNVSEVSLKSDNASWFTIDESLGDTSITVNRPANSAIYVYDKFGTVVYSSEMLDYGENIPLPKGGYVALLGEHGGKITITYSK